MQDKKFCYLELSVLKTLKHIINILVWTLLGLYLLVMLAFQFPAVQRHSGRYVAGIIADRLGAKVNIGTLDYGFPNHLTLSDVLIHDQQGKEMLKARRLSARIDLLPLSEGKISIATAQLFGAHLQFYQRDSLSKPNFRFALDSLASRDTTDNNPLFLRINSLIMRQSSVTYDRYDIPETSGQFNTRHLNVSDISAHIILKQLSEDSLNVNIKRLSFKEKSGLKVERLALKFTGGPRHSNLEEFLLRMPGTNFQIDHVEAYYQMRNKKLVKPSLYYRGKIAPSTITLSDLSCFLPSFKTFNSTLSLSSSIEGKGDKLTIPDFLLTSSTGDIDISIDGWIQQLSSKMPEWQANINKLKLSDKTINFISENMKGRRVEMPPIISRLGSVNLIGIAKGIGLHELATQDHLISDAGDVTIKFAIDKQHAFNGRIETKGINLRQLTNNDRLGMLATDIDLEGRIPGDGDYVVNAKGIIREFDYNDYHYHNIDVNGSVSSISSETFMTGILSIDDSNANLTLKGSVDCESKTNIVQLNADVRHLSPKGINLTDRWGEGIFSGTFNANFTASSLNDAVGTIDISDLSMMSPADNYSLESLHVISGYDKDNGIHFVHLDSDFAQAEITGHFDYETLMQSVTNFLAATLPTLPGLPEVNPNTHNDFAIKAHVTKSDWLQSLLQVPVTLQQPLTLQGVVNDHTHSITLDCDVPSFSYKDSQYHNGHVSILSPNDSLSYDLQVAVGAPAQNNVEEPPLLLHVFGKASNNNLHTSLVWDNQDPIGRMSGQLNAVASFDTGFNQQSTANITVMPSVINIHNSDWNIERCFIAYSNKFLDIKDFTIRHDQQHFIVNGIASEDPTDSITVDLRDIDVEYVLQLVDFDAVDFNGYASGRGCINGIFGELGAHAQLDVTDFKFQHGRMGTLHANVEWNKELERIDIKGICDDGPEAQTLVEGYVDPSNPGFIDLAIHANGTYLDFALSFTDSFISTIDGHGDGAVRLVGPLDAINLTGALVLNGTAHVKTLGCTYEMRNDSITLVPNEITFAHCPIYDIHGNEGMLTGGIHHQDLTNLSYDIYVDTDNLMAYDFPDFGDELFYGTVYARGRAAIHGHDDAVLIEADVTPLKGSTFVYNAAAPDAITNQEFIRWGSRNATHAHPSSPLADLQDDYQSDLTMRLKINATPDATMRLLMDARTGDYVTLRGNGDLQATYYNKGGFTMFGNYVVNNGTYNVTIQEIIRKDFTFSEGGTIVFGGDPYDAQLNLQAQHVVNGVSLSDLNVGRSFSNTVRVNCLMNITGQPRAPQVDFDLDILNVNSDEKQMLRSIINGQEEMRQQVIYLLAVGRFYPQGSNNAAESETERSNTSLAMQSLLSGTLSGQINSMLNQVIKSNNWNFGANISTGDEGWNNAEYEGIINGRLLNNRLLINGQFGYRDNATTANPSFIGDFDIHYLLYPSGNLALKVYNQTNDRYFTKSSLNTQGIGIIMKKDFNGLRDLFRKANKKGKKVNKSE